MKFAIWRPNVIKNGNDSVIHCASAAKKASLREIRSWIANSVSDSGPHHGTRSRITAREPKEKGRQEKVLFLDRSKKTRTGRQFSCVFAAAADSTGTQKTVATPGNRCIMKRENVRIDASQHYMKSDGFLFVCSPRRFRFSADNASFSLSWPQHFGTPAPDPIAIEIARGFEMESIKSSV